MGRPSFLNILFPPRCVLCTNFLSSKPESRLCRGCRASIETFTTPGCSRCLTPFTSTEQSVHLCGTCLQTDTKKSYDQLFAVGPYSEGLARLIRDLKFGNKFYVIPTLTELLYSTEDQDIDFTDYDCVIPVPLHRNSLAQRGFNQAQLLAKPIAKRSGIRCDQHGLRKTHATPRQTQLTQQERTKNLQAAFKTRRSYLGESCLLIDDVYTTGATAEVCAQVLKKAGSLRVDVLTVARTI